MTQSSLDDHLALINLVLPLINLVLLCHLRCRRRLPGRRRPRQRSPGPGNGHQPLRPQGAVIHTRYDLPSVVRSINDALATPMYDAFTAKTLSTVPVA